MSATRRPASTQPHVDVAVVVVTYNSAADIERMLDSLPAAAAGRDLRVVAVDNGSTDGTVELLRGRGDVVLVESGANLGYAGGINLGRRHAGPYGALLVVNADLTFDAGAIAHLADAVQAPGVGVAVPVIRSETGQLETTLRREPSVARALGDGVLGDHLPFRPGRFSEVVRDPRAYATRHAVDWAGGAALMISARCDASVGAWCERFFLYSEEVEYAGRVRAAGLRIEVVPTACARHREHGSGASPELAALLAVNRVRYMAGAHGGRATAFRLAVALAYLLRARDAAHRRALRALLRPSSWAALPSGPPSSAVAATARVTGPAALAVEEAAA